MKYQAIVLAAGSGSRSGLNYNKIFYKIDNNPIILLSCANFLADDKCEKVIIVTKENEIDYLKEIFKDLSKVTFIYGGSTRQESVRNALNMVDSEFVLIHDGARPFFTKELLTRLTDALLLNNSIIPVVEVTNTTIEVKDNKVVEVLDRGVLRNVQTPQAFKTELIKKAHLLAKKNTYTDDSSMILDILNDEVYVVDGESGNVKFTNENDFRS